MPSSSSPSPARGISVALTTYNGETHLDAQLDSIAGQTLLPAELVVCDDISTDGTISLLEAFARRAPFPVHIHPNPSKLGILNNFHRAFSLCSGAFIAYCDQDDVWSPEKLAKCHAALTQPGVVLASHISRLTDSDLRPFGIVLPDGLESGRYAFPHFPLRYYGLGHQMVFARELLPIINRLRSSAPPDTVPITNLDELIPIAAGMLGDTVFIPEELMDFRRHNRAVTFADTLSIHSSSSKASVDSRLVKKQLVLDRQRKIILGLRDWLAEEQPDASGDAGHWARYAAHLDRSLRAVVARLALYQSADWSCRARAFTTAFAAHAYDDPRRGGAGRRQILIDLLAVLKPAREMARLPRTETTR